MSDFSAYRDWAVARDSGPGWWRQAGEVQGSFEELRLLERRLVAQYYRLSFVSTCDAFESMLGSVDQRARLIDRSFTSSTFGWLTKTLRRFLPTVLAWQLGSSRTDSLGTWNATAACAGSGPGFAHVTDLLPIFFPPKDHLHLSPLGSALQACLASHAVLDAPLPHAARDTRHGAVAPLPPRLVGVTEARILCGTGSGKGSRCDDVSQDEPAFCLSAREGGLRPAAQTTGWSTIRNGGMGASKAYLFANSAGAQLHLRTSQPAAAFLIEVYRHHERSLGALQIELPGLGAPQAIEPCCPHPGCLGLPIGRGAYHLFRVPPAGFLPKATRELNVTVLSPSLLRRQSPDRCAREGTEASIAGVIGLFPSMIEATRLLAQAGPGHRNRRGLHPAPLNVAPHSHSRIGGLDPT
jgi:hypothetical protein